MMLASRGKKDKRGGRKKEGKGEAEMADKACFPNSHSTFKRKGTCNILVVLQNSGKAGLFLKLVKVHQKGRRNCKES